VIHSRFRTSDACLKASGVWCMIGSQTLAVLEDPPSVQLPHDVLCSVSGTAAFSRR